MSYRLLNALARIPMPSSAKTVLMAIACHADIKTFETFVGTKTIVAHSGLTRRYVIELRHKLVESGWLINTGKVHKKYATPIYRVALDNIPPDIRQACGLPVGSVLSAAQEGAAPSTSACFPVHPNQSVKPVMKKDQVKTSAAVAGLACAQSGEQGKKEQGKSVGAKGGPADASQPGSDSKLVTAWKAAHSAAGLPPPELSPPECYQLAQIAKGPKAIDYLTLREQVIPQVVLHWQAFCAHAKSALVHNHSKAPFPAAPSVGFLLAYRKVAAAFLAKLAVPQGLEIAQFSAKQWPAKIGKLPKALPKPKSWNTPIWSGHPSAPDAAEAHETSWDNPPELVDE